VQLHVSGINGATCGTGPVNSFGAHDGQYNDRNSKYKMNNNDPRNYTETME
jgi:hypothetical protein